MPAAVIHQGQTFRDTTIYLDGHAFKGCTFERCTLVLRSLTTLYLANCTLNSCTFHLDLLVSEAAEWENFIAKLGPVIAGCVPRYQPTDPHDPTAN